MTHTLSDFPLLRFGLFRSRTTTPFPTTSGQFMASAWEPTLEEAAYSGAVAAIRELIAAGDCYQVNLTMAERFAFTGEPRVSAG
jgi:anthranilate/para-aminobenzoate synthase component I